MRVECFYINSKWTDKISKIPHDKICTEGYDDSFNETHHAIHYTRGELDKRHGLFPHKYVGLI